MPALIIPHEGPARQPLLDLHLTHSVSWILQHLFEFELQDYASDLFPIQSGQ